MCENASIPETMNLQMGYSSRRPHQDHSMKPYLINWPVKWYSKGLFEFSQHITESGQPACTNLLHLWPVVVTGKWAAVKIMFFRSLYANVLICECQFCWFNLYPLFCLFNSSLINNKESIYFKCISSADFEYYWFKNFVPTKCVLFCVSSL